jgi:glutaredoxin
MAISPPPTLNFYTRDGCDLCEEARRTLQAVMENRARRGQPNPRVRTISLSQRPELQEQYGARVPVLAVGNEELALATSSRSIAAFLDRVLGQLV